MKMKCNASDAAVPVTDNIYIACHSLVKNLVTPFELDFHKMLG